MNNKNQRTYNKIQLIYKNHIKMSIFILVVCLNFLFKILNNSNKIEYIFYDYYDKTIRKKSVK